MLKVWENSVRTFWILSPLALVIFLELLSFYPFYIPNIAVIKPCFALIAVYYFAVYAPSRFGLGFAFMAGLFADLLLMMPLGVNALVFTFIFWGVSHLSRFIVDRPFYMVWIGFAVITFVAMALTWLLAAVASGHFTAFVSMLASAMLIVAAYPFLAYLPYLLIRKLNKVFMYE